MQFAVGDKIVHPRHGPGRITAMERKEFLDEAKPYFVIEIPGPELIVYVPRTKMEQIGVRPAMRRAKFARVMETLRSRPRQLPEDYKERQEAVWEKIRTGRAIPIAEVIRDLTWHQEREHLTKKDSDYLRRGRDRLAAEMALVTDSQVSDIEAQIDAALSTALARVTKPPQAFAVAS
jgi:CarD family transcriptional regulator